MTETSGWSDLRKRPLAKQFKQTLEAEKARKWIPP